MADEDVMTAVDSREDGRSVALSVLIVSYNTADLTLACLASLASATSAPHEVIIVDNASSDGSAARIAAAFPQVRLSALPENIGFGRAVNQAAAEATGDCLLLLNPDTVVLPGAIDRLLTFAAAHPAARIWGGRTLFGDGTLNPTSCWRKMTVWSVFCRAVGLSRVAPGSALFNLEAYPGWARDSVRQVDIVTGCLFLIRRDFWQSLCGFDPAFFIYGEEVDLCLRAHVHGARPMIDPAVTIIHHEGAAQDHGPDKIIQILSARIRNIRLHFPVWQRGIAVWLTRAGVLIRWTGANLSAIIQPAGKARRNIWSRVMRRRAEWWDGYPDAGSAR